MSKKWRDKQEFKERVRELANEMEINIIAMNIRPMTRKWASCSTAGTLSFNEELLEFEKEIGEYVMVHELLHIRIPNHGRLWKSVMRAKLGDYERIEQKLNQLAHKIG